MASKRDDLAHKYKKYLEIVCTTQKQIDHCMNVLRDPMGTYYKQEQIEEQNVKVKEFLMGTVIDEDFTKEDPPEPDPILDSQIEHDAIDNFGKSVVLCKEDILSVNGRHFNYKYNRWEWRAEFKDKEKGTWLPADFFAVVDTNAHNLWANYEKHHKYRLKGNTKK